MGKQIIQQPNGRFAIYSSIVEGFTWVDCTRDEVVEIFVEDAAERARVETVEKLRQVVEEGPRRAYAQFGLTWEEASRRDARHDEPDTESDLDPDDRRWTVNRTMNVFPVASRVKVREGVEYEGGKSYRLTGATTQVVSLRAEADGSMFVVTLDGVFRPWELVRV